MVCTPNCSDERNRPLVKSHTESPQLLLPKSSPRPLPKFDPCISPHAWLDEVGCTRGFAHFIGSRNEIKQKGFDFLVQMFAKLIEKNNAHLIISAFHLILITITQIKQLRELLEDFPVPTSASISKIGNMSDWYEVATIFLLPSRYEGFPNVLLEAMAHFVACVASDCPHGPADLASDQVNEF